MHDTPKNGRSGRLSLLCAACAWLAACGGGSGPEGISNSGIYALSDGKMIRMDGSPAMERSTWDSRQDLDSDLTLVAYDAKGSNVDDPLIRLRRVPFVRYEIDANDGQRTAPSEFRWAATEIPSYALPLDISRMPVRAGAIQAKPPAPLESGLYTVQFGRGENARHARFGVEWDDIDRDEYGNRYCIDRYVSGARYADVPCAAGDQTERNVAGLRVGELAPDTRREAGESVLVVKGAVLSEAKMPRRIPRLRASVRDNRGVELDSWIFDAGTAYLLPGGSATFTTELEHPPVGASEVHIDFAGI